ncbi:MAG: MotA/TolQ/ExbB proton channel family protein [Candidatus Hydrogenedentes bacterium]|nr:MotA/TolQ/ExbB proton channel family protein [Candidatus Hydrogenedentota bacterium]
MDIAPIVGIAVALGAMLISELMEGAHLAALINVSAFLLIALGTMGATIACYSLGQLKEFISGLGVLFHKPEFTPGDIVDLFVQLADAARKEGILVLEGYIPKMKHPTLRRGLQLIVDGTAPELVKDMLTTEAILAEEKLKANAGVFQTAGGFAPTLGIIGTVMGLVKVLGNLENASELGPAIAVAFLATFYGIASANILLLPLGKKIAFVAKEEMMLKTMIIEGILSMYAGDNPTVVKEKLLSYLDEKLWHIYKAKKAPAK